MNSVIITSDSGICPLEEENMIPAQVIDAKGISYRDKLEINNYKILEDGKNGKNYTTSSPTMGDLQYKFKKILDNKDDIVHLSMGSGISQGSLNAAITVANFLNEEYENKIYVVDTLTGATGGTLINQYAIDLKNKGYTASEIVEELNNIKSNIETSFFVPDPSGFIRSGRNKSDICLKEKAMLLGLKTALIAGIKFKVSFNEEGNLYTSGILKGKDQSAYLKMIKSIINDSTINNYDSKYIVIGNVLENKINMEDIKKYIKEFGYFDNIINKEISGVVAAYGSYDLAGISVLKKTKTI